MTMAAVPVGQLVQFPNGDAATVATLAAMQRIARWKIAEPELITPDAVHTVQFRFRLDPSQLPRPLQLSALGRSGGNLQLTRSLRLPAAQGGS